MIHGPFEVVGDSNDRPAWLKLRKSGIGASEMAAVLGVSRWESALGVYARKVVAVANEDESEQSEQSYWGQALEHLVADRFAQKTGRSTTWHGKLLRSIEHEWALATLDAVTESVISYPYEGSVAHDRLEFPLECKTANQYLASDWANGAPEAYRIQCHQQMLVTGAPVCFIACLIGGQRFVWDRINRDEQLIKRIVYAGDEMWDRINTRVPPPPDGSGSSFDALEALNPTHEGAVQLPGALIELDDERTIVAGEMKRLKERQDEINATIRAAIGGAKQGVLANGASYSISTVARAAYTVEASSYTTLRRSAPKKGK